MGKSVVKKKEAGLNTSVIESYTVAELWTNKDNIQVGEMVFVTDFAQPYPLIKHNDGKFYRPLNVSGAADYILELTIPQDTNENIFIQKTIPANFFNLIGLFKSISLSSAWRTTYVTAGLTRTFRFYINNVLYTTFTVASSSSIILSPTGTTIVLKDFNGANNAYFNTAATNYTEFTLDYSQPITVKGTVQTTSAADFLVCQRAPLSI